MNPKEDTVTNFIGETLKKVLCGENENVPLLCSPETWGNKEWAEVAQELVLALSGKVTFLDKNKYDELLVKNRDQQALLADLQADFDSLQHDAAKAVEAWNVFRKSPECDGYSVDFDTEEAINKLEENGRPDWVKKALGKT